MAAIWQVEGIALDVLLHPQREVLFDSLRDGCDVDDIPDVPLRLVRRADGVVIAFGSHHVTRVFEVDATGRFKRECNPVMTSARRPEPEKLDDARWISSTWTADGNTIYALVDNEYHAHLRHGQCPYSTYKECWYNTISLVVSTDGGKSFTALPELMPVAAPLFDHRALPGKPRGFFTPSNPVEMDGLLYSLVFTTGGGVQSNGNCLFRTSVFQDPASWEYLTADGFVPSARDPYHQVGAMNVPPCQPVALEERISGVVRHRPSGIFLATVGRRATRLGPVGIYVAASRNLIHWSQPLFLIPGGVSWQRDCELGRIISSAVFVDLNSESRNFEDVGASFDVYATEIILQPTSDGMGCSGNRHRQLVRYRVSMELIPTPH